MNGYLLDTNVALLAVSRSALLSAGVRDAMGRGANYLSVVVYWTGRQSAGLTAVAHHRCSRPAADP